MPASPMTKSSSLGEARVVEINDQGVIWSAIFGGTIAALAFLMIMAPLGVSLGYTEAAPWHAMDASQKAFTLMGAVWLIVMQWISSGIGGYLTGRLRTDWVGAHTHEVFFRDTAHGFLTWALATVLSVGLIATGLTHAVDHHRPHDLSPEDYAVSNLFQTDHAKNPITEQDQADASSALLQASETEAAADTNKVYLEQLVQARTGLAAADAEKRVYDAIVQFKTTQQVRHKAMMTAGLFIFLSMWLGAFIASAAGALGGRHRDLHYATGSLRSD